MQNDNCIIFAGLSDNPPTNFDLIRGTNKGSKEMSFPLIENRMPE